MSVTERTYEEIALEDPKRKWELYRGQLREKPPMSWEHGGEVVELGYHLRRQLNPREFQVRIEGRVRRETETYFMPDVLVVPNAYGDEFRGRLGTLAIFARELPLVVEVWSASTGGFDLETKLPEYQRRGDKEIWYLHPYERSLTAWRRQLDGSYTETVFRGGRVQPVALPNVTIDLDELFELFDA